ncbi:MAG: tRNA (adenosine(37)-N6)-threonylcarbamoyltransferase complex dimerization subunit type 1 TsaB [Flavobacteriaceae bacterium]|nr:tRNA (adenosine(37)-N6)-threonylcarbamoyltransferase complex dimerization subunit type 1 TsaB [Flavobacteriaceae bacterium]MCY4217300.1 tRNA (adenosine(37)-N6)-threonylcarbamoyltransferase complex dimerization subunit type 1 TsaB [Flavobacteriaceae bacterium]MCY4254218.1 tRNA (adenosine(37)-N6)-threonylcarbamoyltransferase complex dimerization subunit type 1 TsaB [Flavobacteriaceae bacterium]
MILHIESSTKNCSVSLAHNGQLIQSKELFSLDYRHSELLHPFIQEIFENNHIQPKSLKAIAVSKGPGSFTGLRIGVSAAKGFCYALKIPLIGINTLEIMAQCTLANSNDWILSILDARKSNLFSLLLDDSGRIVQSTWFENLESPSIVALSKGKQLKVIGDGQTKLKSFLPHLKAKYMPEIQYPSSKDMIKLAYRKYCAKEFETTSDFEPFYLRAFRATKQKSLKFNR